MAQRTGGTAPGEKLLQLFTIMLFSKERQSLGMLAEKMDCSKQTVLRILPMLDKYGGGRIHEDKDGRESVYWMEKPHKVNLSMNAEGLRELMVCKNFLSHITPDSIKKEMNIALLRASEYVGEDNFNLEQFDKVGATITKGRIDYTKFQTQYNALISASGEKQVCRVTYKIRGKQKTRSIAPVNIVMLNNTIYIRGWVIEAEGDAIPKYDDPLTLALHNILKVKPEDRRWEKLPEVDNTGFGLLNTGYIKAVVKFTDDAADYVSDRIWSEDQVLEACKADVILRFTASSRPELISWVLSFGSQAELLEPEDVREEIGQEGCKVAKIYKTGD
jgi:predicted DNA-binding transcriptional regulator YafY